MARDCWTDANRIAQEYAKHFNKDFWVMFAAKPHVKMPNAIVAGWEVVIQRPPVGIVGALVFKWSHLDKRLTMDEDLCLPLDVPISEAEMSTSAKDITPGIAAAARKSGSILMA